MMENAAIIKNAVLATVAAFGSAIANAFGGWDAALKLLIVFMAADYITGILIAALWQASPKSATGALNSQVGFKGLCKKGVIIALVLIGAMLDQAIGAAYVRTAIILFFIGNEGLSLIENLGLMGVPYPPFFKRILESLKEQGEEGESGGKLS